MHLSSRVSYNSYLVRNLLLRILICVYSDMISEIMSLDVTNYFLTGSSEECFREIYIHDHVDGEHTGR